MPTYIFHCQSCQSEFEVNVPWSRKGDVRCPSCQGQTLRELVGRYQLAVVATAGRREQGDTCGCACAAEGAGACCQLPDV